MGCCANDAETAPGGEAVTQTPDIVDTGRHRGAFFRVLQQTERTQTAVMTIAPGADAGPEERHAGDQIVYVIEGQAVVRIDGAEHRAGSGALVVIPAGARHHVRNDGGVPLFFVTVYAPPEY
jgi:mannose-6-phosphate isomerase-like protein (cupin superfamily)